MAEPTREQWQALYAVAAEFRQLAPWHWMTDEDLFGVEEPAMGEVGYCSVMGAGGQEFGLAVFVGAEGFAAYRKLALGEVDPESMDAAIVLRSLVVTFGARDELSQRDREVIRSLGLRFRGRDVWPWFRSERPGYVPWYLEPEEAHFLELALRQAIYVTQQVREGAVQLTSGADGQPVLTRCFRRGIWLNEWRQPPVWEERSEEPEEVDALRVQRLRKSKPQGRDSWQLDFFFLQAAVGDRNERPYFPCMLLVVTQQGLIVGAQLLKPWASATEKQEAVLALLEQGLHLPRQILVAQEDVKRVVGGVARGLGISIRIGDLVVLEAIKEEMGEQLGWV